MARERKQGLDYFSCDVRFDTSLEIVISILGDKSLSTITRIWQHAYDNYGYYMPYNEDELHMIKRKCNDTSIEEIEKTIELMVKKDLFDKKMFENEGILTSKRMQSNYKQATKRRVDANILHTYCIHIADNESEESTQSKLNYTKVNNTTSNNTKENDKKTDVVVDFIQSNLFILKPYDFQTIIEWKSKYDEQVVLKACKIALSNKAKTLKYIDSILLSWQELKLDTLEKVEEYILSFDKKKQNVSRYEKNRLPNDIDTDWLDDYVKNL